METWTYAAGLIIGSAALLTACYVWIRKQVFGLGGGTLSFAGILLLGLSVWTSASVEITPGGFRAEFERLEKRMNAMAEANLAVSQEVGKVATFSEASRRQVEALTDVLSARQALSPRQAERVRAELEGVPSLDRSRIESATRILQEQAVEIPRPAPDTQRRPPR